MKIGTKSVLFGVHCFLIHPAFVALAWKRLYGYPKDFRLWAAFALHDLGYWGKPNLDGPEGEHHVEWGARVMHDLFDRPISEEEIVHFPANAPRYEDAPLAYAQSLKRCADLQARGFETDYTRSTETREVWTRRQPTRVWYDFCLYHSRFFAKKDGAPHSQLCVADKLACALEPWWLYLPRAWASGELWEFMASAGGREGSKYNGEPEVGDIPSVATLDGDPRVSRYRKVRLWHARMTDYMRAWAHEHQDGRQDTWTPTPAASASAVSPRVATSNERTLR